MGASKLDILMNGDTRSVNVNGGITLPAEWRDKHDIEPQDQVGVYETEDGTLEVIPPEEGDS